jgi:hypothetical protein
VRRLGHLLAASRRTGRADAGPNRLLGRARAVPLVPMGLRRTLVVAGLGAALSYFLDPEHGKGRREKLQRTIGGVMKKGTGSVGTPWRGPEPAPVVTETPPQGPPATG